MKTMNQNFYPVFQPKQVLTHNDLNNSFGYLNEQVALTRANLIGTGIVCGLNVSDKEGQIHISKGCGITSGKVRPVSQERTSCDINSGGHYIAIESDQSYRYCKSIQWDLLSRSILCDGKVYELADITFANDTIAQEKGYISIKDLPPGKRIVVLCYELKEYSQLCGSCGGQSYTSPDNVITIRPLLVITSVETTTGNVDFLNFISPLQRLNVEGSSVANIYSTSTIISSMQNQIKNISDAITKAQGIFRKLLKENAPLDISSKIPAENINQNHYDFLCDLTEAYEEFRQCGEKIILNQRLSEEEFPCYLILNGRYRHHFRPATASDDYAELNRLWERLVAMIQYFNETPPAPPAIQDAEGRSIQPSTIRLTPSVYGAVPLSEKAVPYYYKKIDGTPMSYVTWNKHKNPLGYWYEKNENVPDDGYYKGDNWKNYDLEQYNFVRIEGHIAVQDSATTVRDNIKGMASKCQLPIEVIALDKKSDCISPSQEDFFVALKIFSDKFLSSIVEYINNMEETEAEAEVETPPTTATKAAEEARTAAATATKAAATATKAAEEARTAAATATKAAAAETAAATATEAAAAETAAEEATKAAKEATKAAEEATKAAAAVETATPEMVQNRIQEAIDLTKAAKGKAKVASKAAREATKKAVVYAALILSKKNAQNNLKLHLEKYKETTVSYETIISFALSNDPIKDQCKEIISFLQWLDATRTKYQQCNEFSSFNEFKEKHPGIQHKSGVPIGGTFILVHDGSKVIADFCLPYRVTQPAD